MAGSADEAADVQVHVGNGISELVIRRGEATPVELPQPVVLRGTITAPGRFLVNRRKAVDPSRSHVVFNRKKGEIVLIVDEQSKRGYTIQGVLKPNPDLVEFAINTPTMRTVAEMAKYLRMRRQFFQDKDDHRRVMRALEEFTAKSTVKVEQKDDRKGNVKEVFERKSDLSSFLDYFKLKLPLFEGYDPKVFRVEILADVTDGDVRFYLESVDLYEMEVRERESILEEEKKLFEAFVVVEE